MKMCTEKEIYKFHEIYDCYGLEAKEIISRFLHDFFLDQPERLNPEASKIITHPIPDEVRRMFGRCDSPTSENK